jgi:predicted dehydrogenase
VQFVQERPDMLPVACVDSDPQALAAARGVSRGAACQYFTDLDSALAGAEADAALIASPSALHAEHALKALAAGLAVMIEKPFATSVKDAASVLESAAAVGKPVVIAEQFRFAPAERTIRKMAQEGRLGAIGTVTFTDRRRLPVSEQGPWVARMEYPQLQEIAVHHFDSLRAFLGRRPLSVVARVSNPPWSTYRSGACTHALIEMAEGPQVQYLGTLTSHRYGCSVWIEGEKGVAWTNRRFVWWRPRGTRWFRPVRLVAVPRGDGAPFPRGGSVSLLDSLRDAVVAGRVPETAGADNIWTIAMMQAAMRSVAEHRAVGIDEVLAGAPAVSGR